MKLIPFLELLLAGILWGFGFIGTVWCLHFLSPSAIIFYRFFGAFIFGVLFLFIRKVPKEILIQELKLTLIPGILLWFTLHSQTWGLQLTTATNSTFITTLYVIIVPVLRWISGKEILHWAHWACVGLALLGTGLIVEIQKASELNIGDFLTLICAIFAAFHILSVGKRAPKSKHDFAFNTFQAMWVAFIAVLLFPFSNNWNLVSLDTKGWIGIIALTFGSSMIAFFLQIRAQKEISPSVASLLFLLESPAACFFAYLLLNENLSPFQWTGAGLILAACAIISILPNEEPT